MVAFFCGGFYQSGEVSEFLRNSKVALSWANNTLQWGFIKGLREYYCHLECLSVPQIGAYPFRYRKMRCRGNDGVQGNSLLTVPFCNLVLYKYLSQYRQFRRVLRERLKNVADSEEIVVYIYDLNVVLIKAAVEAKRKRVDIKICLIVPDLSSYTGEKNFLHQKFLQWQEKRLIHLYEKVDFLVLISEHMKEKLPSFVSDRCITIEGIYNPDLKQGNSDTVNRPGIRSVFYAGAVSVRNGIVNLLEAFNGIPGDEYRLYICGLGDAVETVLKFAEQDPRIVYKGQLAQQDVFVLQQQSTLLVNPRTPELAFSRYSFPSKTMEYFASGIPVLMYKLDGIPDEYYQYCFCPENLSVEALRNKITEICGMNQSELRDIGQNARLFVEKLKNPTVQCGKIYDFIQNFKP